MRMLFKCGKYTDIRLFGWQQIFDVSRLKSPGLKTVPVRFRLAAPRIPALSFESAGTFCFFIVFCNFSENFCPMRVGKNMHLPKICQQISTKTCFARKRKQTFL